MYIFIYLFTYTDTIVYNYIYTHKHTVVKNWISNMVNSGHGRLTSWGGHPSRAS